MNEEFLAANRALWDEWTEINARSEFYDLESFKQDVATPHQPRAGVRLRPYEIEEVGPVVDKDLLHLQCHFGIDTLSWARLGARVTGVDFSPAGIDRARALAAELGIEATFICSSIDDLPERLEADYDIVYTSRGVITWLPDLEPWARTIAHVLRPGGIFYITEMHPVAWVFDDEDVAPGELRVRFPYFPRTEPLAFPVQGSYADREANVSQDVEYGWPHSMGEIVTCLAGAGLHIEFLHEFGFVDWPLPFLTEHPDGGWRLPEEIVGELPLFFSLRATKPR